MKMPKAKKELIDQAIESSLGHLGAAKLMLKKSFYDASISTSYFAILDVARGALIYSEVFPKSHHGTIHKFSEEFVKKGIFPKSFGAIMTEVEKYRIEADYNFKKKFTASQAKDIYKKAEEFVGVVEKYLKSIEK